MINLIYFVWPVDLPLQAHWITSIMKGKILITLLIGNLAEENTLVKLWSFTDFANISKFPSSYTV